MKVKMDNRWLWAGLLIFLSGPVFSQTSIQPFIDQLKRENATEQNGSQNFDSRSYTEELKKTLPPEPDSTPGSYSDLLRRTDPNQGKDPSEGYTERQRLLLEPAEEGGAIQAVKAGKSELKAERKGEIHHAIGFKYGDGGLLNRSFSGSPGVTTRSFNSVYGSSYSPDITLFYEYQPFHSEWFGNFGIVAMGSISWQNGAGAFGSSLSRPGGGTFPQTAATNFRFFQAPLTLGVNYRFNLFRILRPHILAGPTVILYEEDRDDGQPSIKGFSRGIMASVGASLLLDWISRGNSWDLYYDNGVKHFYLTADYIQLRTILSDLDLSMSGFRVGLTFEL